MELTDILIDLSNSKAALEVANHTIRSMKGKCIRKNILIAGLLWFGFVSCKMVNEAEIPQGCGSTFICFSESIASLT